MDLSPRVQIFYRDVFSFTSNSQLHALGTIGETPDGRAYRWALAGSSTLVVGNVLEAPTHNGSQVNLSTAAFNIGDSSITVVPGAAIAQNQYAGGKVIVSNGGGLGFCYTIDSHAAGNATVNVAMKLVRSESVQVASNSSSRVDLVASLYNSVQQNQTAPVSVPVGVAISPIPNGQYGWIQTKGLAPVLQEGTTAIGQPVAASANVAGAVSVAFTSNSTVVTAMSNAAIIGRMAETAVDGKVKGVFLNID